MAQPQIKVLIVDDSAMMRQLLTEIIESDPQLKVVGTASDPYVAREKIIQLSPDVITLDVEMPRMDGLTFLKKLMRAHPLPVLMVSSLTEAGCETTLRALELGAIDFVTKPKVDVAAGTVTLAEELIEKIKIAAVANLNRRRLKGPATTDSHRTGPNEPATASRERQLPTAMIRSTHRVICVGASTGGTEAIAEVLRELPADAPGIVIVQHMPAGFTRSFAQRLDSQCRICVREARDGDRILPGHALLAPGGLQMAVSRSGANYNLRVGMGEPVNRHRPAVDVLFKSAAKFLGGNAVGVLLTGMGNDGARGMLAMRKAGAVTIAQDEASSVVFGMPREAIECGGATDIAPLAHIATRALHAAAS